MAHKAPRAEPRANAGFGLWLRPSAASEMVLVDLIADFAHRYSGPVFPPHVTLITHLESLPLATRLAEPAAKSLPFACELTGVSADAPPFRALVLKPEHPEPLRKLWQSIHASSGNPAPSVSALRYQPHVSLFYGWLDADRASSALQAVESRLPIHIELQAVEIWKLEGPVVGWQKLGQLSCSRAAG